jgi:pantothenate kinase
MELMSKPADKVTAPFTVRLSANQSEKMANWTATTGQPNSLVVRAAVTFLFAAVEAMDFEDQVRFIADLGGSPGDAESTLAQAVAETWRRKRRSAASRPQGHKAG